jgi:hypothetical protein
MEKNGIQKKKFSVCFFCCFQFLALIPPVHIYRLVNILGW